MWDGGGGDTRGAGRVQWRIRPTGATRHRGGRGADADDDGRAGDHRRAGHRPARHCAASGTVSTAQAPQRLTDASRLRLDGIGPLRVGMTLAQASGATGMDVRVTSQDFGNGCRYAEADGGPAGLAFMVFNGRIVRIDVNGEPQPSPIATLSGIRVGSTEADVMAAYPGRIRVTGNAYLEDGHDLVYTASDSALGLIFVTDGQRVLSFRSGEAGPVSAIEGCL